MKAISSLAILPSTADETRMTPRIRLNRLGCLVLAFLSLAGSFFLLSGQFDILSAKQMARWDVLLGRETDYAPSRNQPVFTTSDAELNAHRLKRISLAQSYENARVALLPKDVDEGEAYSEQEGHEDYIFRFSNFVQDYFGGSKAQEYLIAMLGNLNDHISPPLMKSKIRMGIIKIVGVEKPIRSYKAAARKRGGWEMNVFDREGMDRGLSTLSKGGVKLDAMWRNLTLPEDRKVMLKYLSLLLWGGGYAENDEVLRATDFFEAVHRSNDTLSSPMSDIRTQLQLLSLAPAALPGFIPPSLDPNWTKRVQTKLEQEIGLILYRRPGTSWIDNHPLSSDTIVAKAFHPVFLDIIERINRQMLQSIADGETLIRTPLQDARLYHRAVDRYLSVQYGVTLDDLTYRDEDLRIGDVLLLRHGG